MLNKKSNKMKDTLINISKAHIDFADGMSKMAKEIPMFNAKKYSIDNIDAFRYSLPNKEEIIEESKKCLNDIIQNTYAERKAIKLDNLRRYIEELENKVKKQEEALKSDYKKDNIIYELQKTIKDLASSIDYSNLCLNVALKQEDLQIWAEREDILCSEVTIIKIPIHKKIAQDIIRKANLDLKI